MEEEVKLLEENMIEKLKDIIDKANVRLKEKENQLNQITQELAEVKVNNSGLQSKIEKKEDKLKSKKEKNKKLATENKELREKEEQLKSKIVKIEEDLRLKEEHWEKRYHGIVKEMEEESERFRSQIKKGEQTKETIFKEQDELKNGYKKQLLVFDEFKDKRLKEESELKAKIEELNRIIYMNEAKESSFGKMLDDSKEKLNDMEKRLMEKERELDDKDKTIREANEMKEKSEKRLEKVYKQAELGKKNLKRQFKEKLKQLEKIHNEKLISAIACYKKETIIVDKEQSGLLKKYRELEYKYNELERNTTYEKKQLNEQNKERDRIIIKQKQEFDYSKREYQKYTEALEGEKTSILQDLTRLNESIEKYYNDNKTLVKENKILVSKLLNLKEFNSLRRNRHEQPDNGLEFDYENKSKEQKKPRSLSPNKARYKENLDKNEKESNVSAYFEESNFEAFKSQRGLNKQSLMADRDKLKDIGEMPSIFNSMLKLKEDNRVYEEKLKVKTDKVNFFENLVEQLKSDLREANKYIDELTSEISEIKNTVEEVNRLKNEIGDDKQENERKQRIINKQKEELKILIDNQQSYQKEILNLKKEIKKLKDDFELERENFIEKFSSQKTKISKFESILGDKPEEYLHNNNILIERLEDIQSDNYLLKTEIEDLRKDNVRLRDIYERTQFVKIKKSKSKERSKGNPHKTPEINKKVNIRNFNIKDDEVYNK